MSIFGAIKRAFLGDVAAPRELDFVPVGKADCRTPEKIAAARARLGRPFAPEIKAPRITSTSYTLDHINERTETAKKEKATVTPINSKRNAKDN